MPLEPDVEQALRRSGVVWVGLDGRPPRVVWHVWHDDAVLVVCGGGEQDLPGAQEASTAALVVRPQGALSPRVAEVAADVERLAPGSPEWAAAVALLVPQRLNADDVEALPGRWAGRSTVLRLRPRP